MSTTTITLEINDATYTIEYLADVNHVDITRNDEWAGSGKWNGSTVYDCAADLGDDVYDEIDEALCTAIEAQY